MKKTLSPNEKEIAKVSEAVQRRQITESEVRSLHQQGQYEPSAVKVLDFYQEEFTGWLVRRLQCRQKASEVYSDFIEDVWTQWSDFRWECSFRTWAYRILRNKCIDLMRKKQRKIVPSRLSQLEAIAKNRISTYKLPEVEQNYQLLSEEVLDDEQRDILTLRIGQAMSWDEVARIFFSNLDSDEMQLRKQAAKLRQQFKRIKETLRQEAERRGMVRETH